MKHIVRQYKIVHHLNWAKSNYLCSHPTDPMCDVLKADPSHSSAQVLGLSKVNFCFLIFDTLSEAIYKPLEPSAFIAVFGVVIQNPFFKKK